MSIIQIDIESYYGGKEASGVPQAIINQIPPHQIYIEPFLGRGTIMRHKKKAPQYNIGCDLNRDLVTKWQYSKKPDDFIIHCKDGISLLEDLCSNTIFTDAGSQVYVYCDPPYLIETRQTARKVYKHEFTKEDHIRLLSVIVNLPFNVSISCYDNELYQRALHGWRSITFPSQTRRGTAIETLYMNYPAPEALHDYRYLGEDYRERERIRQKIKRHVEGLKRLPQYERQAIIEAITIEIKN
jgi:DNA adenine methylase